MGYQQKNPIRLHTYVYLTKQHPVHTDLMQLPQIMAVLESTTGWLQLVGSLKFQVSFAEYSLFYRALLQKRPIYFKGSTTRSHPILYSNRGDGLSTKESS